MKKCLVICLVLSIVGCALLALSSCGLGGGESTTAAQKTTAAPATAAPPSTAAPNTTAAPKTDASTTTDAPATAETPATTETPAKTEAPATTAPNTTAEPTTTEHEHIWDEGRETVAPTCTKEGETEYTCTVCGATKTEPVPKSEHDWSKEKIVSAATCLEDGLKMYTCSVCKEKKTEVIPRTDTHSVKDTDPARLITPPTSSTPGKCERACKVCGVGVVSDSTMSYAEYLLQVNQVKTLAAASAYSASDFGGSSITANLEGKYDAPPVNPTKNQHPRVLFNEGDIAGIQAALNNRLNTKAAEKFRAEVALMTDGILPKAYDHGGSNGTHNFNGQQLANIMSLALDYQLTKNQISGYQAIYAAKNYLKTIDIQSFKPDPERSLGNIMYAMACVYDWCYDLMTKTDRDQIVAGVQHKCCENSMMEVGFPPSKQGAVAGHGCEFQILRDYLSFAIAIYDEYPGWWTYVGGRFYQEFVPVRNEFYRAGMVPQGVSQYVQIRFAADCYSALLIKAMTGSLPYDADGMKQVMYTIYSHELPNDYSFASGDGSNTTEIRQIKKMMEFGMAAMITSHLFSDPTLRAQFEHGEYSYSIFGDGQYGLEQTVGYACEELICSSGGVVAASNRREGMDLVVYNGGWLGQMIARNGWGLEQAAVLMKIGVRADSNHGHQDAGQFQIWYKGMLAGDSGVYASYNHVHWKYYHQATIAHNCLLIHNGGSDQYYTGGQISHVGETGTLAGWTDGSYETGVVTGRQYGYADENETQPTYAYIAGDITKAYPSSTASMVQRRMLTVYDTGSKDVPMYFFVFDNITATNKTYKKTFLLHTVTEPQISGNTVTVVNGQGKLVLQSVLGGDNITAIGGKDSDKTDPADQVNDWNNYSVNGNQIAPNRYYDDGYWGRVEISPNVGVANNVLLNVMYVCDAKKNPEGLTATAISGTSVKGAVIGNTAAVFVTSVSRTSSPFTFNASGTSDLNYYVSGVQAGEWTVSVNGVSQTVTATEDGGILTFTAPAGKVSLVKSN